MAHHKFRDKRFGPAAYNLIDQCNEVIDRYMASDLRLTLRQLYYQLVTMNIVPNIPKAYRKLSSLVSDARLAGLMDWEAIEDRGRQPRAASEYANLRELTDAALYSYRLPRWEGQEYYVELWVEKDALAGVLWPLAREFHVTLMVNKGYSSQSAMYEASNRFREHEEERTCHLLYLGDHDPSGEDMVRDIQERLDMFDTNVEVSKVALTMEQIKKYRPPPNPAKITDPRAKKYINKHGRQSWEVDALPPEVLAEVIRDAFEGLIDHDLMDEVKEREEADKRNLKRAVARLRM